MRCGRLAQMKGETVARRIYGEAIRDALIALWEASDRVCGKRLKGKHPVSTAGGVGIDQAAVARTCRFAAFQFQGSSSAMRLAG